MNNRFVNSLGSRALDTVSFLLINSFTHPPIHFFMQNEPNLPKLMCLKAPTKNKKRTQSNHRDYTGLTRINRNSQISALFFSQKALTFLYFYSKVHKKTRTFTHFFDGFSIPFASFIQSFMQNEPNFNRKSTIEIRKSLHLFMRIRRTFTQQLQKIRAFCNFLILMHLTPYTTKTYMAFLPQNTNYPSRNARYKKMQNEPNLAPSPNGSRSTDRERSLPAFRVAGTNMQNKPNAQSQMNLSPAFTRTYEHDQLCGFQEDKTKKSFTCC
jgi:hypothetical protein